MMFAACGWLLCRDQGSRHARRSTAGSGSISYQRDDENGRALALGSPRCQVFSSSRPADSPEENWIQTIEGKGWWAILRLYSPLASFFDKTWRPSEIEAVS
jgi:hypothetical protein